MTSPRLGRRALLAAPLLAGPFAVARSAAAAEGDFNAFLAGVRRDAVAHGIRAQTVDAAFRFAPYLPHVIELDRKQPERVLTFAEYLDKAVNQQRKDNARRHLVDNWTLLNQILRQYGVEPRFVVALWGIESDFGAITGNYPVIGALATLAYDGRRSAYFRAELLAALRILDQGHIRADAMTGSWAGAMGQCHFIPAT